MTPSRRSSPSATTAGSTTSRDATSRRPTSSKPWTARATGPWRKERSAPGADGSIIIIIATDAPLDARQLKRLAKRAALGLARTGSTGRHGSGDFIPAFSTGNVIPHYPQERTYPMTVFADTHLNPLFTATVEATQEAILNALTMATTVIGRDGNKAEAIDLKRLREI